MSCPARYQRAACGRRRCVEGRAGAAAPAARALQPGLIDQHAEVRLERVYGGRCPLVGEKERRRVGRCRAGSGRAAWRSRVERLDRGVVQQHLALLALLPALTSMHAVVEIDISAVERERLADPQAGRGQQPDHGLERRRRAAPAPDRGRRPSARRSPGRVRCMARRAAGVAWSRSSDGISLAGSIVAR